MVLLCLFIVFATNPYDAAQYTLDHAVPGSSPGLIWVYHEQVRQHLPSPTVDERLQFEKRGEDNKW